MCRVDGYKDQVMLLQTTKLSTVMIPLKHKCITSAYNGLHLTIIHFIDFNVDPSMQIFSIAQVLIAQNSLTGICHETTFSCKYIQSLKVCK